MNKVLFTSGLDKVVFTRPCGLSGQLWRHTSPS